MLGLARTDAGAGTQRRREGAARRVERREARESAGARKRVRAHTRRHSVTISKINAWQTRNRKELS